MAVMVALLAGCGSPEDRAVEELREAIARSSAMSGRFIYEEAAVGSPRYVVKGIIEDDLRHAAQVEADGRLVMEEVARDDTLAVRVIDPELVAQLQRRPRDEQAQQAAAAPTDRQLETLASLQQGRWLVDPSGNPAVLRSAEDQRRVGDDPLLDARTVLEYVSDVIREMTVIKFNEDALDYRPDEDPFPKPSKSSGVIRYDFVRSSLPRPADAAATGNQAVPSENNFRKMAVYVRDGLVIRVLEEMEFQSLLDDIEETYDVDLPGLTDEQIAVAVAAINSVREAQGNLTPLRVRTMSFELTDLGAPQTVIVPESAAVGDLAVLMNRGRPKAAKAS